MCVRVCDYMCIVYAKYKILHIRERIVASKQHRDFAAHILQQLGEINPYNRQGQNLRNEYYIYQLGFLAGYLASVFENDPILYREFREHLKRQKRS